jgi:phosphopantetheinyl transferase
MKLYYTISDSPLNKEKQRNLARYLLDCAVPNAPEIIFGVHGKPYFKGSDVFFNYSHCDFGAACIVANCEVGVDIQHIKKVRPSVIQKVCNDFETDLIKSNEDFIKIWTMKEAYAKFTGEGFSRGFRSIDTTKLPECTIKVGRCYISWYSPIAATPQLVEALPL